MMQNISWNKYAKISTTISFLFLSCALLAVAKNPTSGYEISIYSATPLIFWIALILGLLNGVILVFLSFNDKIEKMRIIGMFEIIYCNFLLLTLYALRGYVYIERSDTLSYIGYAKEISNLGYFSSNNFYPIIGILTSQLSQITNQPHLLLSQYLPALFFIFYIFSIYLIKKQALSQHLNA